MEFVVILIVLALLAFWVARIYNQLVELKNRHEKVQENCIDLIGRIADRAAAQVSAREWMRICFELLELLKAPRKSIRLEL